jgi:hypothetical protein
MSLRRQSFCALICGIACWLGLSSRARASDSICLVRGTAAAEARAAGAASVREALQRAGWKLSPRQLGEREVEAVAACLSNDKPWSCIAAIIKDKAIGQVAIVSVDPKQAADGTPLTLVTTRIVVASQNLAYGDEQYCERCNAENVKATASTVATKVLGRVYLNSNRTTLDIKSSPAGARVVVDGTVMGASNLAFEILPGRHAITLSLRGYREVNRNVEVVDGQAAQVSVILEAEEVEVTPSASTLPRGARTTERERVLPSWIAPTAVAAGVAAALVGAGFVFADLDQPEGEVQQQYNVSGRGIGLAVAGVVIAGGGLYLWRWPPTREHTTKATLSSSSSSASLSAAPLPGGAAAVLTTRF